MFTKLMLGLAATVLLAAGPAMANEARFNHPGNVLITDQFNNRVIEVSRKTKAIVWSFGSNNPTACDPGATDVIAPNDAERLAGGLTLIAGTGTSSCADNRVIVVDRNGNIVWQYGQAGVAGSGPNELNVPVFAIETPSHTFLITDQANARVIEVDKSGNIVYQYAPTSGPGVLNNPNSAELLDNGHILIADENNSRVIEIDPANNNNIVFQYSTGLNIVAFASRLPGHRTLIVDSGNNRILTIDRNGNVLFQYATNTETGSNPNPNPTGAVAAHNGHYLIADQFNDRVILISHSGEVVWQYGQTNTVGNGPDQLNAPYSAVMIGFYKGLTRPPEKF